MTKGEIGDKLMVSLEIEEINRESTSLIRSCKINIDGKSIQTPNRTLSVTKSSKDEIKATKGIFNNNFRTFGEVYASLSINSLENLLSDDEKNKKFNSEIFNKVCNIKDNGGIPYIVISIMDNNDRPLQQELPQKLLDYIFDTLYGIPGNSLIVPPILGTLPDKQNFENYISAVKNRIDESVDRKELPIMGVIPSSYDLIDDKLLRKYWDIGCRIFGFNFENIKYSSHSNMIEKSNRLLSQYKKEDKEEYIISGLNCKYKIGKKDHSRVNDLLGVGFGIDIYSKNHIRASFEPPQKNEIPQYAFVRSNYGFENLRDLNIKDSPYIEDIQSSNAMKNIDFDDFNDISDSQITYLRNQHNTEMSFREIKTYNRQINNERLLDYFSDKSKLYSDIEVMKNLALKIKDDSQNNLSKWFI